MQVIEILGIQRESLVPCMIPTRSATPLPDDGASRGRLYYIVKFVHGLGVTRDIYPSLLEGRQGRLLARR